MCSNCHGSKLRRQRTHCSIKMQLQIKHCLVHLLPTWTSCASVAATSASSESRCTQIIAGRPVIYLQGLTRL